MERIHQPQAEAVSAALALVPERIRRYMEFDLFCGDPLFAGISQGWYYEDRPVADKLRYTPHVQFPYHVRDKRLTLCLPPGWDRWEPRVFLALHELGHVLHWSLYERAGRWDRIPLFWAVSEYAKTNWLEAFAEAFVAWFYPEREIGEHPGRVCSMAHVCENNEFFARL